MEFTYEGNKYGYGTPKETFNSGYTDSYRVTTTKSSASSASRFAKLKANAFIGLSTLLFIGTFLAFAIARASARAFDKKGKSQHLLFDDERYDSKSRKSTSRSTRSRSSSRRSERDQKPSAPSVTSKSQRSKSKSRSRGVEKHRDLEAESPARSRSASRSRKERPSSSRVIQEDEEPRRSSRRKERERDADYRRYYDEDF
jgi:hypothetical protein